MNKIEYSAFEQTEDALNPMCLKLKKNHMYALSCSEIPMGWSEIVFLETWRKGERWKCRPLG
jgi:hypothetical protein